VIPESAVTLNAQGASVWVQTGDGTAQLRPVQLGLRLPGEVEVISGLQGGEKVVAEGVQKVAPGRKLIPAPAEKSAAVTNAAPLARRSGD
jgi:membrane fusion protein (multidrug efflux system)